MIKNIIFDFGNVLVCWNPAIVYQDYFATPQERDYFVNHVISRDWHNRIDIGIPFDQCIQELIQQFPHYSQPINMYKTHWDQMLTSEMPGMRHLLTHIKHHTNLHIYGLTNWSMETYPRARKRFPVLQLIDDYVVSGDIHLIKPDPRIYQYILQKYQLTPSQTIFIDDNPANIASAANLGLQTHLFTSAEALTTFLTQEHII